MTTKAQRLMRGIAKKHGQQFALERSVLGAARALRGAVILRGLMGVQRTTWLRFNKATDALQKFHAERQRRSAPAATTATKA